MGAISSASINIETTVRDRSVMNQAASSKFCQEALGVHNILVKQ
jgi:hypothetical protein